jgi:copper oxidase (laccase) domain-containing protein
MQPDAGWLRARDALGPGVTAFMTTRGSTSAARRATRQVRGAARAWSRQLGARPVFLDQVHGADVVACGRLA